MTDLALISSSAPDAAQGLVAWAQAASAAHGLAASLCKTVFVPKEFQNKPDDATAAILYGAEVGLSPLAALQSVYVISGKPSMYARTMQAVVLAAGHELWTDQETDGSVTVCGIRKGTSHVERSTWTIDRARKAGYTSNKKYETDPQAMLWARATSTVCRRVAPDALLGMPYSVEELEDEERPRTTTVTRADTATRTVKRQPRKAAPLAIEPPLDPEPEDGDGITSPQMKKLHALLNEHGLSDREKALPFIAETIGTGLASSRDLTKDQASRVIDLLEGMDRPQPEEPELDWPEVTEVAP